MVMAFLLVVIVNGSPEPTADMYFKNINRCNYFADKIERGHHNRYSQKDSQVLITAYCTPRMIDEETVFWD